MSNYELLNTQQIVSVTAGDIHYGIEHSKGGVSTILPLRFIDQEDAVRAALGIIDGLRADRQPVVLEIA
jgi:hypothetical protein